MSKFPSLLKGLGTIEGKCNIMLKQDARPYALATPWRIPLPLKSQVEQELEHIKQLGIIRKVDVPQHGMQGWSSFPKATTRYACVLI